MKFFLKIGISLVILGFVLENLGSGLSFVSHENMIEPNSMHRNECFIFLADLWIYGGLGGCL